MAQIKDRLLKSWRTSTVGTVGMAAALYLFQALGCRWPDPQEWAVVIAPAVLGILTREKAAK